MCNGVFNRRLPFTDIFLIHVKYILLPLGTSLTICAIWSSFCLRTSTRRTDYARKPSTSTFQTWSRSWTYVQRHPGHCSTRSSRLWHTSENTTLPANTCHISPAPLLLPPWSLSYSQQRRTNWLSHTTMLRLQRWRIPVLYHLLLETEDLDI